MTDFSKAKTAGWPTWVDLTTPDTEASRAFYQAIFGWEYNVSGPEFGGYAVARLGNHDIAGVGASEPGAQGKSAFWQLYLATHALDADVARAVSLGASVLTPAMILGDFGGVAVLQDPGGVSFRLWLAGQNIGWQLAEEPGTVGWCELYSPNAKQARDFYTAMFHLTAEPMPGDMEYYILKDGETMLGGIMQIDPAWGDMLAQWVTYFVVANTDETAALVTQLGGKQMGSIDDSPFGRMAALADPFGAIFKIVQMQA